MGTAKKKIFYQRLKAQKHTNRENLRLLVEMLVEAQKRGFCARQGGEQRLIYETKLNFVLAQIPIPDIFHKIEIFRLLLEKSFLDKVFQEEKGKKKKIKLFQLMLNFGLRNLRDFRRNFLPSLVFLTGLTLPH